MLDVGEEKSGERDGYLLHPGADMTRLELQVDDIAQANLKYANNIHPSYTTRNVPSGLANRCPINTHVNPAQPNRIMICQIDGGGCCDHIPPWALKDQDISTILPHIKTDTGGCIGLAVVRVGV